MPPVVGLVLYFMSVQYAQKLVMYLSMTKL